VVYLEEAGVLVHAGDAEGLVGGADSIDAVVVRDLRGGNLSLDLRVVGEADRLLGRVNRGNLSLDNLDLALEVAGQETGGLED
jgi:hypothetical protein